MKKLYLVLLAILFVNPAWAQPYPPVQINQGMIGPPPSLPLTGGTVTGPITLPNGSSASPSLVFSDGAGIYEEETNQISVGKSGFRAIDFDSVLGQIVFHGRAGIGGGSASMGMNADEFSFNLTNSGTAQANPDISFGSFNNINFTMNQNNAQTPGSGMGRFGIVEKWIAPNAKTFLPFSVYAGYPKVFSGDWTFMTLIPDFSKLGVDTYDGYTAFHINLVDATPGIATRSNLMWLGVGSAKKFEVDSSGYMMATGHRGSFTFAKLATPAIREVSAEGTPGSTTYKYKIVAVNGTETTVPSAEVTIATGNATLTAGNYNRIRFAWVTGATSMDIYRSSSAGTPSSTGKIGTVVDVGGSGTGTNTNEFKDTGLAASGSEPTTNTTGNLTVQGAMQGPAGEVLSQALTTLTAVQVSRTYLNSYGRTGAVTNTLPVAFSGASFTPIVGTQHNSAWKIQVQGADTIVFNGVAGKTYIQETNQAVGSKVACGSFKTGAAAWTWVCDTSAGTWVSD